MPVEIWLTFILIFMIIASIAALEIKDILSSIVAIGVVGLGISISFLLLQAPDLAVVQFLFEIFALIILIRAFLKKDYHFEKPTAANAWLAVITVITLGGLLIYSLPVFQQIPKFGSPLMTTSEYYLQNAAKETGAANFVSSIVLDYRAYDTLGEVTVLFVAILGTLSILRVRAKETAAEPEIQKRDSEGMSVIVKTVTRISVWLVLVYGIYIILHGHLSPGGGFGGGVILALALLNILIAYGRKFTSEWLNINFLKDIESSSTLLFVVVGLMGFSLGGAFLANFFSKGELFRLISSGTILPLNIIIGIKVAMSLFLVVWALAGNKMEEKESVSH